jgi:hypothetical protein
VVVLSSVSVLLASGDRGAQMSYFRMSLPMVVWACISFFSLFVPVIPQAESRLPDDREPDSVEPILPRCYSIADPGIFAGYWNRPAPVLY